MHRAEHRVEDIAIKTGKAHSLLVFPLCLWTLLIALVIGLAVAIFGVLLNLLRYRNGSLG
jgi:flagellar biosynthesis protein FliQ